MPLGRKNGLMRRQQQQQQQRQQQQHQQHKRWFGHGPKWKINNKHVRPRKNTTALDRPPWTHSLHLPDGRDDASAWLAGLKELCRSLCTSVVSRVPGIRRALQKVVNVCGLESVKTTAWKSARQHSMLLTAVRSGNRSRDWCCRS